MTTSRTKKTTPVPPQLIGVLKDAMQISATSFRLETFPTHIMASFSVKSQAGEIDFEMDAGQEMMDYLMAQATASRTGRFSLDYDGRRLDCQVTSDKRRRPSWVQLSWA